MPDAVSPFNLMTILQCRQFHLHVTNTETDAYSVVWVINNGARKDTPGLPDSKTQAQLLQHPPSHYITCSADYLHILKCSLQVVSTTKPLIIKAMGVYFKF